MTGSMRGENYVSQTDNTKDLLKAAVARQHGQDKVVCGVADLWIDSGLCERSCGSFELQSVPLRSMKPGLLHLKQKLGLKNPLTQIVHMPAVQKHFTVTEQISGRKVLTANLLTLLPNPSPAVKSALASVQWSQSAAHSEARTLPMSSTTADSDAPSSTSSSQCITYKAQSQPQEIVPLATPIAAVMVDAQLSQSAGLLHKLHWIQRMATDRIAAHTTTFAPQAKHVINGLQSHLDTVGLKVTFDCQSSAVVLHRHTNIVLQQVFDIQVAQGIIDLLDKFPDSSYQQQQHGLQDVLALYGQQQSTNGVLLHVAQGMSLLKVADKQMAILGSGGTALALKLSRAQYMSRLPTTNASSSKSYSKHAQMPINMDLEMSFATDFKLQLERIHSSAEQQRAFLKQGRCASADHMGDEVRSMLRYLPTEIRDAIITYFVKWPGPWDIATGDAEQEEADRNRKLNEIVADKQREVILRFSNKEVVQLSLCMDMLEAVDKLAHLASSGGTTHRADPFRKDNRMGIEGTLHRISAMRDRHGSVNGLTYRIGRHVKGAGDMLLDVLSMLNATGGGGSGASSLLLLGPPGSGKTTLLRDVVRLLADDFEKRVIVVDTSNEIGGDGVVPHACLGKARRMSPADRARQHEVLLEAVQNHTPEVIVIDEIGGTDEVKAVKTIAQRGVVLVATAHGVSLTNLIQNPDLNGLVGGVCQVTVGDAAAKGNSKTRSERRGAPVFSCLVEVVRHDTLRLHPNVAASVDAILAGKQPATQLRKRKDDKIIVRFETPEEAKRSRGTSAAPASWLAGLAEMAKSA